MPTIREIRSPQARALAEYIDSKYGNRSGVLSRTEANRALKALTNDPVLKAKVSDVFSTPPSKATDLIRALFAASTSPSPDGQAVSVGSRSGGPGAVYLQSDGSFSLGPRGTGADPVAGAPALYEAALLVADGKDPFAGASPAVKARALGVLEASAQAGVERAVRERVPSETTMQMKSGAATGLLALAEAASTPAEANVRKAAIEAYLGAAEKEIHRGLRTSMALNLDSLKDQLGLSAAHKTRLAALVEKALPAKPPYAEWFKNGNDTLQIRHYVHEEFFETDLRNYTARGFTRRDGPNGSVILEKTEKDPAGRHPDVKFRVQAFKVDAYGTDRQMLRDMNDPNVQIEMYTGHSNLGGNIAMALKAAPKTEVGTKLVYLGMCRGKQNIADFTNRFPNGHLITTAKPVTQWGTDQMLTSILDAIPRRAGYDEIRRGAGSDGDHMVPNDRRMYDHRDLDADGRVDGFGGRPDRVFDIYPRAPRGRAVDFAPGPSVDPAKIDGASVNNALAFANTLLTYHVEHGDGRSPITDRFTDKMIADGFYSSTGDEFLRVTPETRNGETHYRVAINSKYANQSEDALGVQTLYELNRSITTQSKGRLDLDDKVRGLLLSAEWLAYMVGPGDTTDSLVRNLAQRNGWPSGVTFDLLLAAIERDSHGYVSTESVNALKEALGARLGDGSRIR